MLKILIIANWKCNPTSAVEARNLFKAASEGIEDAKNVEVVICPPFVYLRNQELGSKNQGFKLGAQDCFWEQKGAYTGEVSPTMLKDLCCEYVIVGHSERRRYFGEDNDTINRKLKAALEAKLKPILCVGERHEEKEQMKEIVEMQLRECLKDINPTHLAKIIIVYEPVWAISSEQGDYCPPEYAFGAGLIIKRFINNNYGKSAAVEVKIIYGGSVDSKDAVSYIKEAKMDGVLVGRASLSGGEFVKIISSIAAISNFS